MIRIFIVEDHTIVIEGIYSLLAQEQGIEIAGYANNAANCLAFLQHSTVDVILMDINLPGMDGIQLCKKIKELYPAIFVLALSTYSQGSYIRKMMSNGASGYLLKNAGRQEIVEAIKTVVGGQIYLSNEASQSFKNEKMRQSAVPAITKREKEIIVLIADGLTNAQVAEKLFISVDTVDSHRKNLYAKLNVKNTAMLIRFAIDNELI